MHEADLAGAVRATTKAVLARSRHVSVRREAIDKFVADFDWTPRHWMEAAPVRFDDLTLEERLGVAFSVNAISFSYWGAPKWSLNYRGVSYDGTWALLVAFRRAIDREREAFSPQWLVSLTHARLAEVLSDAEFLPLFNERLRILTSLGVAMLTSHEGEFVKLVRECDGSAERLLATIVGTLPCFRDDAYYNDKRVVFFKRAQLLVADVHFMLCERRNRGLDGWRSLTGCADYKVPQVLRHMGIMVYASDLARMVDSEEEIQSASDEEIEIRAATIQSIEKIVGLLRERGQDVAAMELNDYLWLSGQEKLAGMKPYHRTRSLAY